MLGRRLHGVQKWRTAVLAMLLVLSAVCVSQPAKAASGDIINNSDWYDTSGNQIWAQGGYVIKEGNTFYWYGLDYSVSGVKKVNLYTSSDLTSWAYQGNVVDFSTIPGFVGSNWAGRPVVAYNSFTSKYVMFMEWNNSDGNGRNKLTYLTSSSVSGPFTYERFDAYPNGNSMGDLGSIFKDDDGSTYLTFTVDTPGTNGSIRISKLAPDYLSIASATKLLGSSYPNKEASTLFKRGSTYYLLASQTNGWGSSPTWYRTASSIAGTWSSEVLVPTSPSTTNSFDTQVDQVLPVQGASGTSYVYMGDRWNNKGGSTGIGRNQWYPLSFDSAGVPTINGYGQWRIDTAAGTWSLPAQHLQAETAVHSVGSVGSLGSGWSGSGYLNFFGGEGYVEWTVNVPAAGSYPLGFKYANGDPTARPMVLSINGTALSPNLAFPGTGSWNAAWSTVSTTQTLAAGSNTIRLTTTGASAPNLDELVISY